MSRLSRERLAVLAEEVGFDLAGVVPAGSAPDVDRYRDWIAAGYAGEMGYMTEAVRAGLRYQPPDWVRSVICLGVLYRGPEPYSTSHNGLDTGWISRYAWGGDYHELLRERLVRLARRLEEETNTPFQWKACVDTYPILERSWARAAGLGWIGKNTCLIHQGKGSWFFLGELLVSMECDCSNTMPAPDRCGSCTRCIDACPTEALVPDGSGRFQLDSRRCISYLTIELRDSIPPDLRRAVGHHLFGCDICQDVCPWNRKTPVTTEPAFQARHFAPPLDRLASLSEQEFREMFRGTPVTRARYTGFLRNVAVAMGNSGLERFREPLERLARHSDAMVAEHAQWALDVIGRPASIRAPSS